MSLRDAIQGIREAQEEPAQPKPVKAVKAKEKKVVVPVREITLRRPTGKSANPEYEKLGLYVRKDLRRSAWRKYEDSGGRDFSDLFEVLLTKYLGD